VDEVWRQARKRCGATAADRPRQYSRRSACRCRTRRARRISATSAARRHPRPDLRRCAVAAGQRPVDTARTTS